MPTPLRSEEATTTTSPSASDNQHDVGTGLSSSESDLSSGGDDDDLERSDFKRQRRFEPTSSSAALPPPSPVGTHSTGRNATSNNPLSSVARHINNNAEFDRKNVNYIPPITRRFTMPFHANKTICDILKDAWGCSEPRDYQVEAIYHLGYRKVPMMYLIRKTGDGKSNVLNGLASLLCGITVCLVPLIGLGSDQTSKSNNKYDRFEAYHADEFRDDDAFELCERLEKYSREELSSIVLFMSPLALQSNTVWFNMLSKLATRSNISAFCIDEAHTAVMNYESFRPEFKTAIETINTLISISKDSNPNRRIPILVMSATFTIPHQRIFNSLIQRKPSIVMWGDMKRRNVGIFIQTVGDPINAFLNQWSEHVMEDPTKKSLVYCNSETVCNGSLLTRLRAEHEKLPPEVLACIGEYSVVAFTGKCGVMMKSYLMEAFSGESNDETLPNIVCMPCTSAANCGVSSKLCTRCYRLGPPPNLLDLVQEMGRVDRSHTGTIGDNSYHIYLNVQSYVQLWIRTQLDSIASVRKRQAEELLETLNLLVLPTKCIHQIVEEHFENPATHDELAPCGNNCSYCLGKNGVRVSGKICKEKLLTILQANIFVDGAVQADKLVSMFTSDKGKLLRSSIWCGLSSKSPGKAHGLVLMMIAAKLIHLRFRPLYTPTPGKPVTLSMVEFALSKERIAGDGLESLSISIDTNWDAFQLGI